MKHILFILSFGLMAFFGHATNVIFYFETGSSLPDPTNFQKLETWCRENAAYKSSEIVIQGHTDEVASENFNIDLSAERCESIASVLENNGFTNLRIEHFGESWPVCNEQSEECKSLNRRVELSLIKENDNKRLNSAFGLDAPQVFFIDASKGNEITGAKGTRIYFPANCFRKEGNIIVRDVVRIELREFFTAADMLKAGLTTSCNRQLIETGGTIEVNAFKNNTQLALVQSMTASVYFPTRINADNMEAFTGAIRKGQIDWEKVKMDGEYFFRSSDVYSNSEIMNDAKLVAKKYLKDNKTDVNISQWMEDTVLVNNVPYSLLYKPMYESEVEKNMGLSIGTMGWINCDRFLALPNLTFQAVENVNPAASYYLVFHDIKAIMPIYENSANQMGFPNVPIGKKATLVAVQKQKGELFYGVRQFEIGNSNISIELNPVSQAGLDEALASIDWD